MNKFTLTFSNSQVEDKYQLQQPTLFKQAILVDILCVIYAAYDICHTVMSGFESEIELYLKVSFLVGALILNIVVLYDKKYFKACFFIANILVMFEQMNVNIKYPPQQAFNLASNLMLIHSMIIYLSDFIYGAIQIGSHLLITIGVAFYAKDANINFGSFIVSTMSVHAVWLWVHYTWTKSQRLSYLLTLQQTQYENIIPKLMVQDFCLFTYDKELLNSELKLTNMFQNKTELTQYLRRLKIKNTQSQTLEHYLLKNNSEYQTVEALDLKKTIKIEINELSSGQRTFFLRLICESESQVQYSTIVKQQQYLRYLVVIMKQQLRILFQIFKVQKHFQISKAIIIISQALLQMNEKIFLEGQDNYKTVKRLMQLFNQSSQQPYLFIRRWDQKHRKLSPADNKIYLIIIIEVLSSLDQSSKYDFFIYCNSEYIGITVNSMLNAKLIGMLSEKSKYLQIQVMKNQTRLNFYLNE